VDKSTLKSSLVDRFDEIYRVTVALFLERGYDNTPLSLIAQELGLSKAGLYHHFESKEQLLFQIHKYSIEATLVPVIERAEVEPDPRKRLEQYIREFAEVMVHDPAIRVLIEESKRLSPENLKVIQASWRRGFELMRSTIAELQAKGAGKNGLNPTIAAFAAIGMCSSTPYWFSHTGSEKISDVGQHFAQIFCHGALEEPPANEA
jgi:TetR/AcrR family transcriptional regulator, cholesterol catabolism regulator